jgi:hypothetical protein
MGAGALVDASVYPAGGGVGQYISAITVGAGAVLYEISDATGVLCSGESRADGQDFDAWLYDKRKRPSGVLVASSDAPAVFGALPEGRHEFAPAATELVASCVLPQPQVALTALTANDSDPLTGDVWLVGSDGVYFHGGGGESTDNGVTDGVIRMDVGGDPFFAATTPDGKPGPAVNPLRHIKLVFAAFGNESILLMPDEFGNFSLTPGTLLKSNPVLRVESEEHTLRIRVLGNVVS